MKLYEFFGNMNLDLDQDKGKDSSAPSKEEEDQIGDELFWYIIDHDDLHKNHFLPAAKEIKKKHDQDPKESMHDWKTWAPMVNSGCMKYWKEKKMKKHPTDAFPKDLRKDLCKRLADHYHKDIIKDEYKLGR
jgi:hypothetical protein